MKKKKITYHLCPLSRGEYVFHDIHIYVRSLMGFVERRISFPLEKKVSVYPSIIEMKKYELFGSTNTSFFHGIKKIRKIGHSYAFEQIKNYDKGDDIRSINWKASGHHGKLMVNQYEDEKAQQVYSIIDKSRVMLMPFKGLSLLDYAINTCLVISNVALQKKDKAGLLSFSNKIESIIKAENKKIQLRKIMRSLYKEEEREIEADYELLFVSLKKLVRQRSLLFLYTNFESLYALERILPVLRKLNKAHLLVVIFFENSDISDFIKHKAQDINQIYEIVEAEKYIAEKQQIAQELKKYGIQSILCRPEDLSIHVINKYLELKARGMI